MVAELVQWAYEAGYEFTYGDGWRGTDPLKCPSCQNPHTYQELLVFNGRSKKLYSKHSDRLAVDFNVFKNGVLLKNKDEFLPLGEKWESMGGRWGGRFGVSKDDYAKKVGWDAGHFEYND